MKKILKTIFSMVCLSLVTANLCVTTMPAQARENYISGDLTVTGNIRTTVQARFIRLGDISATSTFYVFVPEKAVNIISFSLVSTAAVTKSDTNYWTFSSQNRNSTTGLGTTALFATTPAGTNTTKSTGGTAIVANVLYPFSLTTANVRAVAGGSVINFTATKTSSATTITEAGIFIKYQGS